MKKNNTFRGIFTIPVSPFRENGEIDIPSFRRVVDFCVECGAHGLVFPVNASEFTTLSDDERLTLTEVLVEQNAGRIPAIIGVAASTKENAARFAKHASEVGADGLIAMPPYVKRGDLPEEVIFDYYVSISDAGELPIFIQNYVPPIGTDMSAEFLLRLCREIENVHYIKEETVPSTIKLTAISEGNDGVVKGVFGGSGGRYLIEEYRRGSDGNMPGCHVTDVVVALWNALESGDEERATHIYKEMAPLFFYEAQLPGTYKEVLYRRGVIDCPVRRNSGMLLDDIASKYLDDVMKALEPLLTWGR
jgi:dihydrodipicolinate synthase/N-acetylneuraminate lyase